MPKMDHGHTPEEIASRLSKTPKRRYLRDWVYGGIDGAVTTFALVAGVAGASLSYRVLIILGLANIFADGFSMAAANFLSTRSEHDEYQFFSEYESSQVERLPYGEKEEIRQIYIKKGFEGELLDQVVDKITANRELWVEMMVHEEYGISSVIRSPWLAAWNTFFAFVVCGFLPLLPFLLQIPYAFVLSIILTGVVFCIVGSLKSRWSIDPWYKSAFFTLLIGVLAAGIAYIIGLLFKIYT